MHSLVSVVIPCHNAARWIAPCLQSVRAQTWENIEVLVVDDGSTDESAAIAENFFAQHQIGRVFRQKNSGAAAARQKGFEASRGDFIQYLDADDLLDPGKIAFQVARLAKQPSHVASCRWYRFDESATRFSAQAPSNWGDFAPTDYLIQTFDSGGMMHPAAWLTPRSVAETAGPWNSTLSLDDDGEYFTRVVLASQGVSFCPDAVSYYRSNLPGSLSSRRNQVAWNSAYEVCRLSTEALLARDRSPSARRACARYWQRLAFASYPEGGDITKRALAHARELDPTVSVVHGGRRFELLSRLIGWRAAKRLRTLVS